MEKNPQIDFNYEKCPLREISYVDHETCNFLFVDHISNQTVKTKITKRALKRYILLQKALVEANERHSKKVEAENYYERLHFALAVKKNISSDLLVNGVEKGFLFSEKNEAPYSVTKKFVELCPKNSFDFLEKIELGVLLPLTKEEKDNEE